MGHTHYWYLKGGEDARKEVEGRMPAIVADFVRLLPHLPPLAGPTGEEEPILGPVVAFNGPEPDDYESFIFPDWGYLDEQEWAHGRWAFSSCKTGFSMEGRRPYDLAVQAFLLLARIHLGDLVRLSSDAPLGNWVEAASLIEGVLGFPADIYALLESTLLEMEDGQGRRFLVEVQTRTKGEGARGAIQIWDDLVKRVLEHVQIWDGLGQRGYHSWPFKGPYQVLGEFRLPQEELPRLYREPGFYQKMA